MAHFRFKCGQLKALRDVETISRTLARHFSERADSAVAIHEMLINAIEHGNLGIGFERKAELLAARRWQDEVTQRLAMPEYRDREVLITMAAEGDLRRLTIADQGAGFAWNEMWGRDIAVRRLNGRGLWIAYNSDFDAVGYNEKGNEVTFTARRRIVPPG